VRMVGTAGRDEKARINKEWKMNGGNVNMGRNECLRGSLIV